MRKLERESKICCICTKEYIPKNKQYKEFIKSYCPDCRGSSFIKCPICSKEFKVRNASLRTRKNLACSVECKAIAQRKDWNDLSRNNLKQRWISEFGIENFYCRRCGHDKTYNVVLHHIVYVINGGDNQPDNLEPLCLNCHGEEHYDRKDKD